MPSRNVIRNFANGNYYHVFNRGVERRTIFIENKDYHIFLYYMFIYLAPFEHVLEKYPELPIRLHNKNLHHELDLVTYCLMPNHFHLLLRQNGTGAVSRFMKQLTNAYTFYFNQKHQRVGGLVQGRFKAVEIDSDELLLHVSRYIHLNPIVAGLVQNLKEYQWSSYLDYIGRENKLTCTKDIVLSYFTSLKQYEQFILDHQDYARKLDKIKHLTFED